MMVFKFYLLYGLRFQLKYLNKMQYCQGAPAVQFVDDIPVKIYTDPLLFACV